MKKHLLFILALIFALCSCGEDKQQLYEPLPAAPVLGEPYVSEVTMKSITVNLPVSYSGYPKASEFSVELFENQDATGKLDEKYMRQIRENEYSVTFYKDISNFSSGGTYYFVASAGHDTGRVKSLVYSVTVPDSPLSFRLENVSDVKYRVVDYYDYTVYYTPKINIYNPEYIDEIKLVFAGSSEEYDIEFDKEKPSVYDNRWSTSSNSSRISNSLYVKALLEDGSVLTTQTESFDRQYSGGTGGGGGDIGGGTEQTGTTTGTIKVITGYWDSYLSWVDGQTFSVEWKYDPSTGKYMFYGGPFCSDPDANGGKGVLYECSKGYNSVTIEQGRDLNPNTGMYYQWYVQAKFTF